MFISIITFLLGIYLQDAWQKIEVQKTLTLEVPSSFYQLTLDDKAQRYVASSVPLMVFADASKQIDVVINPIRSQWQASDLQLAKSFFKTNLQNLYHEVIFNEENLKSIGKQEVAYFEFTSTIIPEEGSLNQPILRYTLVQYAIIKNQTWMVQISCPEKERSQWEPSMKRMMTSVTYKK